MENLTNLVVVYDDAFLVKLQQQFYFFVYSITKMNYVLVMNIS